MLNKNLQYLRKEAGLTQEQLAGKLGVTRQTVSKWENGASVPDADILSQMASVLDVSVSELLGISVETSSKEGYAKILAVLNEELAEKNQHRKTIIKIIKIVLILISVGLAALAAYVLFWMTIAATM